ncbi:MAG: chromosome segregation protein SMC [Oscillospiraceae bacterium]
MYLKSLELQGFKSFPDKIKLDFDKGITAVVGPNGSGKSNIGDAMRWVLGEQSSKTLRGGKMEDVIFSGTQLRKSVGFAKVTLTIDNADHALAEESDLVAVSRKLYRSGESEYMINGKAVRLKDVVELFMDTGLGRDGYSIIGQGRIAEIVSSKSGDRREIFEEAAGIAKFRYKKEEAARRLAAAQDNILRLTDIIAELESRIEPLRVQSEKAKQFRTLDEEKRNLEISVWVSELTGMRESLSALEDRLLISENEYENLTREIDALEEKIQDGLEAGAQYAQEIEAARAEIHAVELETSRSMADIAVLENDVKHIGERIFAAEEQVKKAHSSRAFLTGELEKRRAALTDIAAQTAEAEAEIAQTEQALVLGETKVSDAEQAISVGTQRLNQLYIEKSAQGFQTENAKNNLSELETLLASSADMTEKLAERRKNSLAALEQLSAERERLVKAQEEQKNVLGGYARLLADKRGKLSQTRETFSQTDLRIRELKQKLQILNDLENSMEGFSRSVREVMRAKKQNRISGIYATIAQLVTVERAYAVAVETALGGALHNIAVENEDTAKRAIRLLKETNAGRATFLPVTTVKGSELYFEGLADCFGFVALGSQLVQTDETFSGIIRSLLGRICIAEDLDSATAIAKKYGYKFKIVTLDGQVINAGGSFTGGSVARSTGILTRKNEIEDIERELTTLTQTHAELKTRGERLSQETAKLSADIEGAKDAQEQNERALLLTDSELNRLRELCAELDVSAADSDGQRAELVRRLDAENKLLDEAAQKFSQTAQAISELEQALSAEKDALSGLQSERVRLAECVSALKIRQAELAKDDEACRLSIVQLEEALAESAGTSEQHTALIAGMREQIAAKLAQADTIRSRAAGADEIVAGIREKISLTQQRAAQLDRQTGTLRSALRIKNDEKETVSRETAKLSEKRAGVTEECDKIISALWEQYELTRTEAIALAVPLTDKAQAARRLGELKTKIKALGTVNLAAIEEFAEVSERYGFLSAQLKDVLKSKTELCALIDSLTENMRDMFTKSFSQINENFRTVFAELFGGGRAELVLCDPDDVLNCGIDIKVAPPGKVINSLSLLSGGEQAFVAIAIYFAILKLHPSPFCLLDEIEAALDDVNVVKYAQYLRRFTDTTQFIAITHRRGTMEEADVLYGVTMQEKGISRLLRMTQGEQLDETVS